VTKCAGRQLAPRRVAASRARATIRRRSAASEGFDRRGFGRSPWRKVTSARIRARSAVTAVARVGLSRAGVWRSRDAAAAAGSKPRDHGALRQQSARRKKISRPDCLVRRPDQERLRCDPYNFTNRLMTRSRHALRAACRHARRRKKAGFAPAAHQRGLLGIARNHGHTATAPAFELPQRGIPAAIDRTSGREESAQRGFGERGFRTDPATAAYCENNDRCRFRRQRRCQAVACIPKSARGATAAAWAFSPTVMCSGFSRSARSIAFHDSARGHVAAAEELPGCVLLMRAIVASYLRCCCVATALKDSWPSAGGLPLPNQCLFDAHDSAPFENGGLQVPAHSHRQRVELRFPAAFSVSRAHGACSQNQARCARDPPRLVGYT